MDNNVFLVRVMPLLRESDLRALRCVNQKWRVLVDSALPRQSRLDDIGLKLFIKVLMQNLKFQKRERIKGKNSFKESTGGFISYFHTISLSEFCMCSCGISIQTPTLIF